MMERKWLALLFIGAVWASQARANDFRAGQFVNGLKQYTVDAYPATLRFTLTATNIDPRLPSELHAAVDPLLQSCTLSPPPPLVVPPGEQVRYQCEIQVRSYEDCLSMGEKDSNPATPNNEVTFTSTFSITWASGASQAGTNVLCLPQPSIYCDDTVYLSTTASSPEGRPTAPSRLYIFDPATGALTLQGEASLPYDALAFNHVDSALYAISSGGDSTPRFIRVGPDGASSVIAPLNTAAPRASIWSAGSVLKDGTYVAFENVSQRLIRIDPGTGQTLSEKQLSASFNLRMKDFAVNPRDGLLYAFNNATQRMTTIDPLTGVATDHDAPTRVDGKVPVNPVMNAAVFTRDGELFFFGEHGPNSNRIRSFLAVNVATGELTTLVNRPVPQFGDGAMCGYYFWATPRPQPPTRDRGFFGASESALLECLAHGPVSLGALGEVSTLSNALGVLWANPVISSNHKRRTPEESLKVRTAREALTAVCNERFFGTPAPDLTVLAAPVLLDGEQLEALRQRLERHNHSGRRTAIPLRKRIFAVDPLRAMERAEEPRF